MRMKHALVVFAPVALVLQLGSAGAAPDRDVRARWEEAVEPRASKIIIHNLSTRPAEASLGSEAVAISANGVAEIPAAGDGQIRLSGPSSDTALLVLQVPDGFDAGSVGIEQSPSIQVKQAAAGASVRHGATGVASVKSKDPQARVEVAVEFLAPHTSVRIRQLDTLGNEMTSLVASSSQPVLWRAALDQVAGESRIELQTLRGEAQGTAAVAGARGRNRNRGSRFIAPKAGGLAKFTPTINWQGSADLYFTVTGGPASLCGTVYVSRNGGSYVPTANWICTDGSGNATKGPWTYAGQSGDELAFAYVIWSNGESTNTTQHIWDKTAPTVTITSPGASPAPTSFSGTATDPQWGSGFSSNFGAAAGGGSSSCTTYYYNTTTGWYWCPGSGYGSQFPCNISCAISGMPSHSVTWSVTPSSLPPGFAHFSGQCYEWGVYLWDNTSLGQYDTDIKTFCVP